MFGFQGAISALAEGQILHYNVKLNSCRLLYAPEDNPEFVEPFGGQVVHYRSINEKQPEQRNNLVFFLQKLVFNNTGI